MITQHCRPTRTVFARTAPASKAPVRPARVLPVLLAFLAACVDPKPGSQTAEPPPELEIARLAIDPDESLELEPGAGVGVAVDYQGDGSWRISATCDTQASGTPCDFDVVARTGGADDLVLLDDAELEPRDETFFLDPFALELLLETEDDVDSVTLSASPGAVLRLTVWFYDPVADSRLDWTRDPHLISWVGHGAVHWGAPTNPVELEPAPP